MKKTCLFLWVSFAFILFSTTHVSAVLFSSNTSIGVTNTSYDGQDIVISNCIVTVDGAHMFNSLLVATNGVLTHSSSPNGALTMLMNATNEAHVLSGTAEVFLSNSNIISVPLVTDPSQTIIYTIGTDYTLVTNSPGAAIEIARTGSSSIPDGGTVLVDYSWNQMTTVGLNLTISGAVTVAIGGQVSANGIGYGSGNGPGSGTSSTGTYYDGSGGGDGGNGGMSASNAVGGVSYDSLYQPALPGSGGGASYAGNGGNGGGLIQIVANGNMDVEGVITANGANAANSRAGGGSGGGIYLSAANFSGAGSITANGGAGAPVYGGGGGGGHIAIVSGANSFSGSTIAYGGSGATYGGAGTIYTQLSGQTGLVAINNDGNTGANSTISLPTNADLVISGNAGVIPGSSFATRNLTIGTNSSLIWLKSGPVNLIATGDVIVQPGGNISANGIGGTDPFGNGGSSSSYGGGGGHGGYGGAAVLTIASGGLANDQATSPIYPGGTGGGDNVSSFGGAGGGIISLEVSGTLQVNGVISANGLNGSGFAGGGGAGGTILVSAGFLTGSGILSANGANGEASLGGGGGGGCISLTIATNLFAGSMVCYGGNGANNGGAGTVYFSGSGSVGQLVLDDGGNTPGPLTGATPISTAGIANVIIQNGAAGMGSSGTITLNSLLVASNSLLTIPSGGNSGFNITSNATFLAGSQLNVNSIGFTANQGDDNGFGGDMFLSPYSGAGGGSVGAGGNGISNSIAGGRGGYQTVSAPTFPGAGGGGDAPYSIGGSGGGYLPMTVGGTLLVNGIISANGGNGSGIGGGGGSGGAINLNVGILAGSGSITANGGSGVNSIGGGGGGGAIAVIFNTNQFTGITTAYGGGGVNYGGAGSIYFRTNSTGRASIIVDNGGRPGALSGIQSSSSTDMTVRSNGIVAIGSVMGFDNVIIASNSMVLVTNFPLNITAVNVTIQSGGGLNANTYGYTANNGNGHGGESFTSPYYASGGGGNGGNGGASISNVLGGAATVGSSPSPTTGGGGGGGDSPFSIGGTGGGLIELSISGTLQVNGTLSANGGSGSGIGGGGGAGGSLQLNLASLTGSGLISANGGAGAPIYGGGGGGGIIAITFQDSISSFSNLFNGTITAYGGGGANYGGAGTIFIKTNANSQSLFIVDNGGNRGTNTPISYTSPFDTLLLRNGGIAYPTITSINFLSFLITSNAWLVPPPGSPSTLSLNVPVGIGTIQAGGGILADGYGYPQNVGNGHGSSGQLSPFPGSGGGHGGDGAFAFSNEVAGGITYDSVSSPVTAGSGGGGINGSAGGAGGGYISLSMGSSGLVNNGTISANGLNGSGLGGGGGSGGTIIITANTINGNGSITANGGNGASVCGGGGGGGRIALTYSLTPPTNVYAGTVTAYGGGGANYGGAGTIYYLTNKLDPATLLLDNGGNVGTNTPFDNTATINVTVQNGAIGQLPFSLSWTPGNILISSNSAIVGLPPILPALSLKSLTIAQGGVFSVDGSGDNSTQRGTGGGAVNGSISGGAGYGGYGGGNPPAGGQAYGSVQGPILIGSAGANSSSGSGGSGGGVLSMNLLGTLTVNGRLSANGLAGAQNAGAGSGGSLFIQNFTTLAGNGVISANGGTGLGTGGSGGGGRIALYFTTNLFSGQISAVGGSGLYPGGAGTVYSSFSGNQILAINNNGIAGTNTPIGSGFSLPSTSFELDISGAASVVPVTPLPLLSNLNVAASSMLTLPAPTNFFIGVLNNATIAGSLNVNYLGYPLTNGPGAGVAINNDGSGGGYGGAGGVSGSSAPGGVTYGSAATPIAFGSGGGNGTATVSGGSDGGGALRLTVLGQLNVSGNISANGNAGLQDNSGGGSGGSIWITAGSLGGAGNISARGGNGVLFGGGGGGGGRIAIYTSTNNFTGTTNVSGGTGSSPGQAGTVYLSSVSPAFQVVAQSPTGLVMNTVSSVNLSFSDMVNPASISASDFTLITPAGPLPAANISASANGPFQVQVSFPPQNLMGTYAIQAGTSVASLFGQPLTAPYSGTFSVSLSTISGTITGTNGAPVSGVLLQPDGGLTGVTSDVNGNYALGVPPGWNGTVTPALGANIFLPNSLSYTNFTNSLSGQNYLMVATVSPSLTTSASGGNLNLNWPGLPDVTYQLLWSTNLVNWQPLGSPLVGSNGLMQIQVPIGSSSEAFFQLNATY